MIDFKNIEYLKNGNSRQKMAYSDLMELKIFEKLKKFNPLLTGTIPIEIDLPESDLDIICQCENHNEFTVLLSNFFSDYDDFEIKTYFRDEVETTVARFRTENFLIEIFGQNISTEEQNAYMHMIAEYNILRKNNFEFRNKIIQLKSEGFKTEPAFAKLLGLDGDPYKELLKFF